MPGKSAPYRNISSKKDEYGLWIKEVLDHYEEKKISFVVSSYSSSMFLSFAKRWPERVESALLLVPSGIAHGPVLPMMGKMVVPFLKYYLRPSEKTNDIFFPAGIVFKKAKEIFSGPVTTVEIDSKHLPSEETMSDVCKQTKEFLFSDAEFS